MSLILFGHAIFRRIFKQSEFELPPLSSVGGRGRSPKPEVHRAAQTSFLWQGRRTFWLLGRYIVNTKVFRREVQSFSLMLLIIALLWYLL